MDSRTSLQKGSALLLGETVYTIVETMGFGSNAFVYLADYQDNLQPDKTHTVLIKELFPYHPGGLIARNEDGSIFCNKDAAELFVLHKNSFLRGNAAHLDFSGVRADMTSVNINSYDQNGTVYTVIGNSNGETLQTATRRGEITGSLREVVMCLIGVLDALDVFHMNGLLHLDISPDNILLMPPVGGRTGRRVMLIDYNSVFSAGKMSEYESVCFSVKEDYSAPEVRLQDKSAVRAASDLFSVCAIFFEYLRGEPMDFASLYSGVKPTIEDAPLLAGVPKEVATRALAIVRKGLRFSPKQRYQSVLELKIDFIELLNGLTRAKRKRMIPIVAIGVLLTGALVFGAIRAADYFFAPYPRTTQEKYEADNAMTSLADSMGRLGRRINNDLLSAEAYSIGNSVDFTGPNAALIRDKPFFEEDIRAMLSSRSPIPPPVMLELLNSPEDYAMRSDDILEKLSLVFDDNGVYPETDRMAIAGLYTEYIDCYAEVCYIKLQLAVLPLSADGKKQILNALPYIAVFGEKFMSRPFVTDKEELENAAEAASVRLRDIEVELKSYGL